MLTSDKSEMTVKNRQSRGIRYKTQTEQNKNKAEKNKNKKQKQKQKQNKTKQTKTKQKTAQNTKEKIPKGQLELRRRTDNTMAK